MTPDPYNLLDARGKSFRLGEINRLQQQTAQAHAILPVGIASFFHCIETGFVFSVDTSSSSGGGTTFSGAKQYGCTTSVSSGFTDLVWPLTAYDTDGYVAGSEFVVPAGLAGYFLFTLTIEWTADATGDRTIQIRATNQVIPLDTVAEAVGPPSPSPDGTCTQSCSGISFGNDGDSFLARATVTNMAGSLSVLPFSSSFTVSRLGS